MKTPLPLRLGALATSVSLVAGCSTPPVVSGCLTYAQQQNKGALATSVLSPELGRMIGVRDTSTSLTATGLPDVQTTIYNCTDVDVTVLMRTRFMGERGQSEPPSAWRSIILPPRAEATYAENAVSPNTHKVAIDIYDAQRAQQPYAPGQSYRPFNTDPGQQ